MRFCCHLHIGSAKTGTTSIQSFLQLNVQQLGAQGYYFPHSLGQPNNNRLVTYALDPSKIESKRRLFGIASLEDLKQFRSQTEKALGKELASLSNEIEHVVLSNEHCHSRLTSIDEIYTLKQFLDPFFSIIRVIVYLRRQDLSAISLYNTRILSGSSSFRIFPPTQPSLPLRYDYAQGLQLYAEVFGQENIVVRVYDRRTLKKQPLVHDFAQSIGLAVDEKFENPARLNRSLRGLDLQFIRLLNLAIERSPTEQSVHLRKCVVRALRRAARKAKSPESFEQFFTLLQKSVRTNGVQDATKILEALQSIQAGHPIIGKDLTTRRAASQFYSHFKTGNLELTRRFLPQWRGPLFDEDFNEYA
jgi:hypothetical protein